MISGMVPTMLRRPYAVAAIFAALSLLVSSLWVPAAHADPPMVFPGSKITYLYPDGRMEACTAGFIVTTSDPSMGFLTAGHCAPDPGARVYGTTPSGMAPVGSSRVVAMTGSNTVDPDIALVDMKNWQVSVGTADVNGVRVSGVSNASDLARSRPRLCKLGQVTSWTCGQMINVTGDKVMFRAESSHGDSGSPVVALWPDGKITAVGILDGSPADDDSIIVAQMISGWMNSWALKLV